MDSKEEKEVREEQETEALSVKEKPKKTGFWKGVICTILVIALLVGAASAAGFHVYVDTGKGISTEAIEKMNTLGAYIDAYFLEDIEDKDTYLYKSMLDGLHDPYSTYYTKEEYEDLNREEEGEYVGLGIVLQQNMETGEIKVVQCYEGAPGEKAGILPGDILFGANGKEAAGQDLTELIRDIQSAEDQIAHLEIQREGEKEHLFIDVHMEHIVVPRVTYEMKEDRIGYIRIHEFTGAAVEQYKEAFADLQSQGMERLVIDLRDNPGGLLNVVCDILDEILPKGLSVYMEYKDGTREEYECDGEHELQIPLAVLVNENSASASELFAGAVQDHKKGTLVGTTTFGKGIVQMTFPLEDESAVKLTVAQYFTPAGRYIHGTGITPDVEVEQGEEQDDQLFKALEVVKGLPD